MARTILLALLLACCQSVFAAGQLYRVTHEGKPVICMAPCMSGATARIRSMRLPRALLDSRALVIELDIREDKAFQLALARHARYPDGDSVQRHLAATLDRCCRRWRAPAFRCLGAAVQALADRQPAGRRRADQHGYQRSQAVEYALLAAAQQQDKTVRELESADYQLGLFDSLDERQQEQYLLENLADLADGDALKKSQALLQA
jgi:uncharacterized protein YbaP (TraB family)